MKQPNIVQRVHAAAKAAWGQFTGRASGQRSALRETAGNPPGSPENDWRRLTSGKRDLSPVAHDRQMLIAHWLWFSNPLAKRCLEILRDLIVAEGWTAVASSDNPEYAEQVQGALDKHWGDKTNDWDGKLGQRVIELCLFGEQAFYAFLRPQDGRVRIGCILPENIKDILTNPLNAEEITKIVMKQPVLCGYESNGKPIMRHTFEVIRLDEDPNSATYGTLQGEVFFWHINKLSGATRGLSDLLPVADWLDTLDQLLFNETERGQLMKSFIYDVKVTGATEQMLQDMRDKRQSPRPGTTVYHNEAEEWSAVAPDLKHADAIELIRFVMLWILGGLGIPEHYYSEANTVNKASASEMGAPVFAKVRARQNYLKANLEFILRYVVDAACVAGVISVPLTERGIEVRLRDPERNAYEAMGNALKNIADALANAQTVGWLTKDQAGEVFRFVAEGLGMDIPEPAENGNAPAIPDVLAHVQGYIDAHRAQAAASAGVG